MINLANNPVSLNDQAKIYSLVNSSVMIVNKSNLSMRCVSLFQQIDWRS